MHFRRVCRFCVGLLLPCRTPLAGLFLACAALGCGADRYIVIGTARAPSTSGFVELTDTSDTSARVRVRMEQLHPASSLDPSVHAYVVWFESGLTTPVRAGSLHYNPDERTGELEASSPYAKFVVKITAEANDKPAAPSAFVVASQKVSATD